MSQNSFRFAVFCFLISPVAVLAQGLTGQLSGAIVDPSGASLASAEVSVANVQTGQSRTVKTDNEGRFLITELLPGTFTLEISAAGFKKFEQQEITISATERVVLPTITMQVGRQRHCARDRAGGSGADGKLRALRPDHHAPDAGTPAQRPLLPRHR